MSRFDAQRRWRDAIDHFDAGRHSQARELLLSLQIVKPDFPPLLHLLAMCEYRLGDSQTAVRLLEQALHFAPQLAPALSDYGNILLDSGNADGAMAAYQQAVQADPRFQAAAVNLARLQACMGDAETAIRSLEQALSLAPDAAFLRWTKSLILLSFKDFPAGWREYGIRWSLPGTLFDGIARPCGLPALPATATPDRPVWVWTEQGIGDEILHTTVLPDAIRDGWPIRLGCSQRTLSLFRRSFPDLEICAVESPPANLTECQYQFSAADLVARYRRSEASFGDGQALLKADAVQRDRIRERYDRLSGGRKLVGLSWRSTNRFSGSSKSPPVEAFAPLLQRPDCAFVNLQYGPAESDLNRLRRESGAMIIDDRDIDPLAGLDPYAAQIAAMDAVVSVSNTTVHLAGGLGVPTIVLLPKHDGLMWYWFRSGERSPWYSSLRLVRQARIGDWQPVIAAGAGKLDEILNGP